MAQEITLSSYHFILIEGDYDMKHAHRSGELSPLDVFHFDDEVVTIDVVRELYAFFTTQSLGSHKKALLRAGIVTHEAQNALLKLTEELREGNQIVMAVDSHHTIIPTLRSRAEIIRKKAHIVSSQKTADDIDQFIKKSVPARLKAVESIVKKKDAAKARAFVEQLIHVVRADERYQRQVSPSHMLALHAVRRDLDMQGMSIKLLMEYISLILPKYV